MMGALKSILYVFIWTVVASVSSRELLELEGSNFELTLSTYKYLAVLFYDHSTKGNELVELWENAAGLLEDSLPDDCEIGKVFGKDPELKELIETYEIRLPSIKVFRRGMITDYTGPLDSQGIANYIRDDAQPSVKTIKNINELKAVLSKTLQTTVLGFFNENEIVDEQSEGIAIDPWSQFVAAADSLRGHAIFCSLSSSELLQSFKLKRSDLPAVYLVASEGDSLLKYSGEILEINLSEWILRNSAPAMGELSMDSHAGELYATQFFSSRKLKFILFLKPEMIESGVVDLWKELSILFTGKAIFAYMTQSSVADVVEYFGIDVDNDLPMIAAHQPTTDSKYKSTKLNIHDREEVVEFVTGVVTGVISKVIKSELIPTNNKGPVITAVGNNAIDLVSKEDTDVLLAVYIPWCSQCKKLIPALDLLGRAVQGESKISVVKINALANDIPKTWDGKNFPILLWFPAKDKPYNDSSMIIPRPYWDAGFSLQEMITFVLRESSFDPKTLRVATSEQIGSLLSDEETLRVKYEEDERTFRRNEGREVYEEPWVDWFAGEVIFDGKRWHIAALIVVSLGWLFTIMYAAYLSTTAKVAKKKKIT